MKNKYYEDIMAHKQIPNFYIGVKPKTRKALREHKRRCTACNTRRLDCFFIYDTTNICEYCM